MPGRITDKTHAVTVLFGPTHPFVTEMSMFMLLVKFHSGLLHEQVLRLMDERLPQFRAVPGLVQKYYAREPATGDYVGIYLFDSEESLLRYRSSELAASIPATYQVEGTARREVLELLFPLHAEPVSVRIR